jgi:hypothetical protein
MHDLQSIVWTVWAGAMTAATVVIIRRAIVFSLHMRNLMKTRAPARAADRPAVECDRVRRPF